MSTFYISLLWLSYMVSFGLLKYTYWDFRYKKAMGKWLSPWRKTHVISIHLMILSSFFQISRPAFHFPISELSRVITFPRIPIHLYTPGISHSGLCHMLPCSHKVHFTFSIALYTCLWLTNHSSQYSNCSSYLPFIKNIIFVVWSVIYLQTKPVRILYDVIKHVILYDQTRYRTVVLLVCWMFRF